MKLWTVDCQNKLSEVSTDTCPSPSAILNPKNPAPGLVSWFHESGFGFGKSGLNKRTGFWNRFQFWSNQTGPKYQWNQTIDVGTAGLSKQWTSIRHILSLLVTANACVHVTAYVAVRRSLSTTYTAVVLGLLLRQYVSYQFGVWAVYQHYTCIMTRWH